MVPEAWLGVIGKDQGLNLKVQQVFKSIKSTLLM